jgi:hypothetical protein
VLLDGPPPPRALIAPNARANSWEDVADLSASLGMPLDEWQEQALEAAMGERADGRWASKFVGISAPRQNGKSQLIVARALAGVLLFGEKMVIISAHETDTAREIWKRLLDVIEANPTLEARVTGRMDAINREFLSFGTGLDRQTIKLKARRASGARGFSADCLLLDEAQILGKQAWGSIVPTMSAMPNPQLWLFGTPPTVSDDPFAFSRVRDSALSRRARHCWMEWSADPGDDLDDEATWAKANPAYGIRISREACADDRSARDDDQFAHERLGMWAGAASQAVIDSKTWNEVADAGSVAVGRLALAVDVDPDRSNASVGMAGQREDGLWHVELDEQRQGVGWLVGYLTRLVEANPVIRTVVIDGASPAASIVDELTSRGVRVTRTNARDMANACGSFYDGAMEGWLRHIAQPQLNTSLATARRRPLGDAWAWNRKNATSDITPIVAVTLALWGAQSESIDSPRKPSQAFAF